LFVIPHRRETIKQPVHRRRGVVPLPEEQNIIKEEEIT